MDWKDLKPIIGGSAPLIGKLIGVGVGFIPGIGPIAGPIIGPAIGNILAKEFGVPATPEAVANAIQSNPDEVVKAKLAAATEQVKAQYEWAAKVETGELHLEEVALGEVNATMRVEAAQPESLFFRGWRPAFGWCFVVVWGVFGLALTYVTLRAAWLSDNPLQTMRDAWPLFASYFGPGAAVLGVLIPSRSYEKGKAMETAPPLSVLPATQPKVPMPPVKPTLGPRIIPAPAGSRI